MKYGWLGKQGVLFVESVVRAKEYDDFIMFATGYQPEIKKLEEKNKMLKIPLITEKVLEDESSQQADESSGEVGAPKKKLLFPPKFLKNAVADISKGGIKAINAAVRNINKASGDINTAVNSKKIEAQEYSCLTLLFYLQGLGSFLGLSEV